MKRFLANPKTAIYACGFLFSIQLAITSYVNSSFLAGFIGTASVGLVYSVASALGIIAVLALPRAFAKYGLGRFIPLLCAASMFFSFALSRVGQVPLAVISFIGWLIANSLIVVSFDALLENFSDAQTTGSTRGTYLAILNFAWLCSPLISGALIERLGYGGIYMTGALLMIPVCLVSMGRFAHFHDPAYVKISIRTSLAAVKADKNMTRIFAANFLLQAFYVVMVIYSPLYLHSVLGFPWRTISIIFTVMLAPFVLFELPLGKLSDRVGEKKILIEGFAVAACATAAVGLLANASVALWAFVLFATRTGAAAIEVMTESYFFKTIAGADASIISIFRTLSPLAYIIMPSIASVALFFGSLQTVFLGMAIIMLLGIGVCFKLVDKK